MDGCSESDTLLYGSRHSQAVGMSLLNSDESTIQERKNAILNELDSIAESGLIQTSPPPSPPGHPCCSRRVPSSTAKHGRRGLERLQCQTRRGRGWRRCGGASEASNAGYRIAHRLTCRDTSHSVFKLLRNTENEARYCEILRIFDRSCVSLQRPHALGDSVRLKTITCGRSALECVPLFPSESRALAGRVERRCVRCCRATH